MKIKFLFLSISILFLFFSCKQPLRPLVNDEGLSGPIKEKYDTVFQINEKQCNDRICYSDTLLYYFERYTVKGKLWQAYMYEGENDLIESVQYSFDSNRRYKCAAYSKRDLDQSYRELYYYLFNGNVHIKRMHSKMKIGSLEVYYTEFGCKKRLLEYDSNDSAISDIHFEYNDSYYLLGEYYLLKDYHLCYNYIAFDAYDNWTQRIVEYYLRDELVVTLFESRSFVYYSAKDISNIDKGVY